VRGAVSKTALSYYRSGHREAMEVIIAVISRGGEMAYLRASFLATTQKKFQPPYIEYVDNRSIDYLRGMEWTLTFS
jgi:hypothetical protein